MPNEFRGLAPEGGCHSTAGTNCPRCADSLGVSAWGRGVCQSGRAFGWSAHEYVDLGQPDGHHHFGHEILASALGGHLRNSSEDA
eukprot:9869369-Alexandrium_andersonii.AAC.3